LFFIFVFHRLTFAAPHNSFFKEQVVESVLVPGVSGDFCILVGHVPTIAQLRPGTVTITPKEGAPSSFFVSGGFAFVSEDSTCNVNVPEAARLEDIDLDAAKETVRQYETQLGAAKNDEERAAASIALEVAQALVTSLTTK